MHTNHDRLPLPSRIQAELSKTPFACSTLTALKGGSTSFVFLGDLVQPFSRETGYPVESVVVKYAADYLSCSADFPIDPSRCKFEASMLTALDGARRDWTLGALTVSTPGLFYFSGESRIQVVEYFPNTITVKEALTSLTSPQAASVGRSIGSWLRAFHDWTAEPAQASLRDWIAENKSMEALKWKVTYEQGSRVLERFPDICTTWRKHMWEDIKRVRKREENEGAKDGIGIVHGDFWSGNILVCGVLGPALQKLHVIDFELSHVSHRAVDVGQFIGDLLETSHFDPSLQRSVMDLIKNFVKGYGKVTEDMAFRIAMYAGVHMINWWSRGPKGEDKDGEVLLDKALEMVARAWKKDGKWLKGNEAFRGFLHE